MFRYPDKPALQVTYDGLATVETQYVAQLKMDGWRCVVEYGPRDLTFTSRHKKPIPVSDEYRGEVSAALPALPLGTMLDAEWLGRRAGSEERLWVFDIMQLGDVGLWSRTTVERFAILKSLLPDDLIVPTVPADTAGWNYQDFFYLMRDRDDAEGIVLKRRDAKYIGSFRQCALNASWIKCKWRAGEDGQTVIQGAARCLA